MTTLNELGLIPFPELIRRSGASRDQIDRLRHLGTLRPRRIGNYLFFPPTSVETVKQYLGSRNSCAQAFLQEGASPEER